MAEVFVGPDVTGDGVNDADITPSGSFVTIGGVTFTDAANTGSGTGNYNTFLAISDNDGIEEGFNSDDTPPIDNSNKDIDHAKTHTVKLSDLVIVTVGGVQYYEFRVDLNESNSDPDAQISLDQFKLYSSDNGGITSTATLFGENLIYDMDAGSNKSVLMSDAESSGSGNDDYAVLVPTTEFAGLDPTTTYVYLYVQMGAADTVPPDDWDVTATFEEWNLQNGVTLTGTKFEDLDGDGIKDAGEGPVEGVTIFIDANQNGVLDAGERTTLTDANGNYTFFGVATGQEVWIDEVVPAGATQTTGTHEVVIIDDNATPGSTVVVDPIGNFIPHPAISITKAVHDVDGDTTSPVVDEAGDVVNYTIDVSNTGNVTLTGLLTEDQVEALGAVGLTPVLDGAFNSGDTNDNGAFDPGETWHFTAAYTVTQDDIDGNGGGDGILANIARADTVQTNQVSDDADVPIVLDPALGIEKSASVPDDCADVVGELVSYTILVTNEGNVSLENVVVTDDFADPGSLDGDADDDGFIDGDDDEDGVLDLTETWTYTAYHTVTQDDIDNNGNYDSDDDGTNDVLRNIATANADAVTTGEAALEVSDDATVEVCQDPALGIEKSASVPDDCADVVGELVSYTILVTNEGNVSLENVVVTDDFADPGSLDGDADDDGFIDGDDDEDGVLDLTETWTYTAYHTVTQDDIDNNGNYDSDDDGTNDVLRNIATANADAVTTGEAALEVSDDATVEVCQDPALGIEKSASVPDDCADVVGELVSYTILVTNEGNVGLENVVVTDDFADPGSLDGDADDDGFIDGDDDEDGVLDLTETWTYTAYHTVTQDDIDNNGNYDSDDDGTNDVLRNIATANADAVTTGEAALEVSDDATVEVCQDPALGIEKSASVPDDCADVVGELVSYTILVTNEGNVSLENVVVTDDFADPGSLDGDADDDGFIDGDDDEDGVLDLTETWTYTAYHTVTQDDIDNNGNYDSDDDGTNDVLRNIATANADAVTTGEAALEVSDDATVEVCQDPLIDLEKYVNVNPTAVPPDALDANWDDADAALGPQNVNLGTDVWFKVTLENTGNVTLTDVDVTDNNTTGGLPGTFFDLVVDGQLTADAINNHGATLGGDTDGDNQLDVDETWTIIYSQAFDPGNHVNEATVTAEATTTAEEVTDDDLAHYFSLVDTGLCPRTPGFWQNPRNGAQFWDGIEGNEKHAGQEGFPEGELLYAVDSNNDGFVNEVAGDGIYDDKPLDQKGLLIGDYDKDGLTDVDEDTLFVSFANAQTLINASNKQLNGSSGDGRFMLGRDMVASWLNYLQGSGFGEASDPESPRHYLDDSIDWMQIYSGTTNGGTGETFDTLKLTGGAIKTSAATWKDAQSGFDHSAGQMHAALDYYNNTGQTEPGGTHYANCEDEHLFEALSIYKQTHELV